MAQDYRVVSTQKYSYLDETNRVVDGYRVFFFLPGFDETHSVNVPSIAPDTVKAAISKVVADRIAISKI
jgi:hypothetical protein